MTHSKNVWFWKRVFLKSNRCWSHHSTMFYRWADLWTQGRIAGWQLFGPFSPEQPTISSRLLYFYLSPRLLPFRAKSVGVALVLNTTTVVISPVHNSIWEEKKNTPYSKKLLLVICFLNRFRILRVSTITIWSLADFKSNAHFNSLFLFSTRRIMKNF